jgi:excisionase family DNA binding protein
LRYPRWQGIVVGMETPPLTRGQVAARLGISPERVRELTIDGRLPCTQTPLGRLYNLSDVEALTHERGTRTKVGAK